MMATSSDKTTKKHYDYLYKFLLVGDTAVGKTGIWRRFIHGTYSPMICGNVGPSYETHQVNVDGARIKLAIWDTAGNFRFHTITFAYFNDANGFLLVYDVTNEKSFESIEYWMREIKKRAHWKSKIIIVGNKCKDRRRQVSYERGKEKAREYNVMFMETDPKESYNIEEVFMYLARSIYLNEKVWDDDVNTFIESYSYSSPLKNNLIEIFGKDSLHDILKDQPPFIRDILFAIMIETSNFRDQAALDTMTRKCGISGRFSSLNDVIRYSEALRAGVQKEICIKVFVLGTTGAGKTSLSKSIEKENCYIESPPKTLILDIHESHLDENIQLKLFDAGGDSEYYLISTQFLHSQCIFIIVVDGTIYSKNLFQPCIGVYLDVIVSDCQTGYLFVVVTKSDDDHFRFGEDDAVHIESQIRSYLQYHGSKLMFRKDCIWKVTTRDKNIIDSFREKLRRVIIDDNDYLDKRKVPYIWSKFVEELESPVMEYTRIREFYDNFTFPGDDDHVLQVSVEEKEILVKLEELLKVYLQGPIQKKANLIIKDKVYLKRNAITLNDNDKMERRVYEKLIGAKEIFLSKLLPEKKGAESKKKIIEKDDKGNELVDTILRFYRNRGRLVWLENLKNSVFTEPKFLLEMLRSVISHDVSTHVIQSKLSNSKVREIVERGLLNIDDLHPLMRSSDLEQRLPDRDAKEFLVDILIALGLASRTIDGKLFVPALIQNNDLELISSIERSYVQNYENCLTVEVDLDKCGSTGMYVRILVKLKNKKVILEKLFSQKIEMRTNGIVSGVEGTVIMKKKDDSIEEFSFLLLEKELVIDSPTEEDVDRVFGGKNAAMASFRTITLYIKHKRGSDSFLWNVLRIFKDIIVVELERIRNANPKYRLYCYSCCRVGKIGYFETNSDFQIKSNTDLCSGKDKRHHLASFEEDEKKWIWDPANKGEITKLFTDQNLADYDNKRSFNELYATLEPGDQIWYYKKAGENKLALGNAYAHVMVYVGNDEVVHVYKPKLALPLIAQIEKHHIDTAIPIDVRKEPNFFLGHEVLNLIPVVNEKEIIAEKARACLKHEHYPVIEFNYNAITTNCETFANALLGKFGYCEQASGLNEKIRRAQDAVNPLIKGFNLTRKPLMEQIQERLASKGYS